MPNKRLLLSDSVSMGVCVSASAVCLSPCSLSAKLRSLAYSSRKPRRLPPCLIYRQLWQFNKSSLLIWMQAKLRSTGSKQFMNGPITVLSDRPINRFIPSTCYIPVRFTCINCPTTEWRCIANTPNLTYTHKRISCVAHWSNKIGPICMHNTQFSFLNSLSMNKCYSVLSCRYCS